MHALLPMYSVWVTGHPHRFCRQEFNKNSPVVFNPYRPLAGDQRKNVRLTLPKETWFLERLRSCGITCDWDSPAPTAPECRVQGVLVFEIGTIWPGPLTQWSLEARFLRSYLRNPQDTYSVKVVDFAVLEEPQQLLCRSAGSTVAMIRG